jgi:hypothetical protein
VVNFELPDLSDLAPAGLIDATLRLHLLSTLGEPVTEIQSCRADRAWSEGSVNWANQPGGAEPCTVTEVGSGNRYWVFAATEYVRGVLAGQWPERGFVLRNTNEQVLNERAFHSRQSGALDRRPELELRVVGDIPAADLEATFESSGTTLELSLTVNRPGWQVTQVEFFNAENFVPPIASASAPQGWAVDVINADCLSDSGPVQSGGIRVSTATNPILVGPAVQFGWNFAAPIQTEVIQMQLTGSSPKRDGETYLGRILAARLRREPPPEFTVDTDQDQYAIGDPLTLLVNVESLGSNAVTVDPYIVLQQPNGALYSYVFPASFVAIDPADLGGTLLPVVSHFPLPAGLSVEDLALFSLNLGTQIPTAGSGTYQIYAALAAPGSLNLLTPIAQASFVIR